MCSWETRDWGLRNSRFPTKQELESLTKMEEESAELDVYVRLRIPARRRRSW